MTCVSPRKATPEATAYFAYCSLERLNTVAAFGEKRARIALPDRASSSSSGEKGPPKTSRADLRWSAGNEGIVISIKTQGEKVARTLSSICVHATNLIDGVTVARRDVDTEAGS